MTDDLPNELFERIEAIDRAITTRAPTALDTALLLVERKSAYETLFPDAGRGGDRRSEAWRDGTKPQPISFSSATAAKLGLSERSVQLAVAMGEAIAPYAEQLRSTPISDNAAALRGFVALDPDNRATVIAVWKGQPRLSYRAVLVEARLQAKKDTEEAQFRVLLVSWSRASSKARRRFLEEIGITAEAANEAIRRAQKRGSE